jgi:hypothetical protein
MEYRSPEEALAILVFFVGFPRISLHFVVAAAEPGHAGTLSIAAARFATSKTSSLISTVRVAISLPGVSH